MNDQLAPTHPGPPPLRIYHLMACAAVAAVQLSWWRNSIPLSIHIPAPAVALTAVYEAVGAIGLTLAIFSVYWHLKGYASLAQPGQWLLMQWMIALIPIYMMTILLRLSGVNWAGMLQGSRGIVAWALANLWTVFLYNVIPLAIFIFCAWKIADTRPWRIVFVFSALSVVITTSGLSRLLLNYSNVPMESAFLLPILLYAGVNLLTQTWSAISDLATQRARLWTHWAGVGLSLATQLLTISSCILNLLGWFA